MKKLLLLSLLSTFQISGQCVLPVLTSFECSAPAVGSYPTSLTTIENPDKSGLNETGNVGKYDDNGTEGFDAIIFDYEAAIDLSTNNFLKLKLHTSKSVQILAKLEGGSTAREVYSDFVDSNDLNSWIEFTFDFSAYSDNAASGDGNTKIVLFVNPGATNGNNPDTYYLDDIMWSSSATAGLDSEIDANKITVFPTIFDTNINIKSEEVIKELVVYDLNGKLVFRKIKINSNSDNINLSKIAKGNYFLKIVSEKYIINSRIIKK